MAPHSRQAGIRRPLAASGATVDALILARQEGNLLDHLADVAGYLQPPLAVAAGPGLLRSYGQAFLDRRGVMRANLRADTVFQRGDDLAAGRVILGIGGEDQQHVGAGPDGGNLYLDVALLHDV